MLDLAAIIKASGYLGIFAIIFSESGLLVGLFLPGDSLLFTAGILASQAHLDILMLISITFIAAVSGDSFGYYFGKKLGPKIFTKENSIVLSKDHIQRSEHFFKLYGPRAIILARFMPVIRTVVPIMAGVGTMRYATFILYNVLGSIIWAVGIPLAGFFLGNTIPSIDRYLIPIILVIVLSSAFPTLSHLWRKHRHQIFRNVCSFIQSRILK